MITIALLVIAAGFVGYSVMTHYSSTLPTDSVFKRVLTSVAMAGIAAGSALVHAIHTWTAP